jgi:hypothetical protein
MSGLDWIRAFYRKFVPDSIHFMSPTLKTFNESKAPKSPNNCSVIQYIGYMLSALIGLMWNNFKLCFLHGIKVETQSYKMVYHTLQLRNNGKGILL